MFLRLTSVCHSVRWSVRDVGDGDGDDDDDETDDTGESVQLAMGMAERDTCDGNS